MPARSMTGFAQSTSGAASVTIKSWNQRHLEPHWQVPPACEARVPAWTARLRSLARRGRIEVRVQWAASASLRLDWAAVDAYLAAYRELARRLGSSAEPHPAEFLRLPGVWAAADDGLDHGPDLETAFTSAIEAWDRTRAAEGAALAADVAGRVDRLAALRDEAAVHAASVAADLRNRLVGASAETVALAERSDVTEELVRLEAHLAQARAILSAEGEIGKRLDFLAQELNREATTLLSKPGGASPAALRLGALGLDMKIEIEKIREQAQNLE